MLFFISLYCDTSFKTKKNTEVNFLIKMIEYYFSNKTYWYNPLEQ